MISVQVSGIDRLIKIANSYPEVSEKHVNTAIRKVLTRILGSEKREAPFGVSGILRDNWSINVGRFTGTLESLAPYAVFVHEGTAPHFPPLDAIAPWAIKHGIPPFVLARSIAKKGTKANPFLKRAVDAEDGHIESDFLQALEATLSELAQSGDTL